MRKLAIFSAAFALAAAIYVYLFQDVRALWLAGACLALSALGRWLGWRRVSIAGLGMAFGILWCFVWQTLLYPVEEFVGTERTVTIRLDERPVETSFGGRVTGQVFLDGRDYGAALYDDGTMLKLSLQPGDFVTCTAQIELSGLSVRDGESLYLRSQGISLCLYAQSQLTVTKGHPSIPARIRMWLQDRIHALYRGEMAGLVRALLTGDRSELSYRLQNELSVAGISHAVAVSGMHVSVLLAMVAFFCGSNPRLVACMGIPIVVLFALMTGASPSVCRAAVMQILLLCAPLARRESDGFTTLGAAALVILLANPWAVASVSFQLSFAAVIGLFLLSGPMQRKILSLKKKPGRLLRFIASGVAATLSATALTLPLTVYYFGLISIAAPLTNLLALWAVSFIFILALLSCCLGPVGSGLAWVVSLLARYVLGLSSWIARFPFAAAYPQNLPLMIWAVCAYALALTLLLVKGKRTVLWPICGLTAAFLCCIVYGRWNFTGRDWRFAALDVGQGQCLVYQMGDYTAVIDCGGSGEDAAGETAARYFHSAGVTRIDALVLTHYDLDHCGGVPQLMTRMKVDRVFLPNTEDHSGLRQWLEDAGCALQTVETTTKITAGSGEIRLYPSLSEENENNGGITVLATAAEYDILVTGDLDQLAEMRLLSCYDIPDAELLVAGHHGAKDATSSVLLEQVHPETVLISVDADNPYGHPAAETLDRIREAGAEILRTDQQGTIIMTP